MAVEEALFELPSTGAPLGAGPTRLARIEGRLRESGAGLLFAEIVPEGRVGLIWPRGFVGRRLRDGGVEVLDAQGLRVLSCGELFHAAGVVTRTSPKSQAVGHEFDVYLAVASRPQKVDDEAVPQE